MSSPRVIAHLDLDAFYSQVERKRLINDGFIDDDDDTDDAACCSTSGNKMMMKMRRAVCVAQYNPFEKGGVKTLTIDDRRILDCEDPATDSHSLIAVSYEARAMGIKRNMRVGEAKRRARAFAEERLARLKTKANGGSIGERCLFVQVPTRRSKADLTPYRDAGAKVASILASGGVIERASIDEAYLDLTEAAKRALREAKSFREIVQVARMSHVAGASEAPAFVSKASLRAGSADAPTGVAAREEEEEKEEEEEEKETKESEQPAEDDAHDDDDPMANYRPRAPDEASLAWWDRDEREWSEEEKLLAAGAYICRNLRARCVEELGFTLSAGVAQNKMLAKLTSGMNKPASQTVLCPDHTQTLLRDLPIDRIRGLGAKFGRELAEGLDVKTIGELALTPLRRLEQICGEEKAQWVRKVSLGLDDDPVKPREMPKSIGTGKTFRGGLAIKTLAAAKHWLTELAAELNDRCEADEQEWNRVGKLLTLGLSSPDERGTSSGYCSRSCPMRQGALEKAQDALALLSKWASGRTNWSITGLSVSASNFASLEKDSGDVMEMFKNAPINTTPAVSPIKAHEIDAAVLAELPEDIQREIKASFNNNSRVTASTTSTTTSTSAKRSQTNSITNYFSKKKK
jgi:DNA polymerase eta